MAKGVWQPPQAYLLVTQLEKNEKKNSYSEAETPRINQARELANEGRVDH